MQMEKDLTPGSVFKNIILFSLPYLLSYFLQTLYGMADLFIIGQFADVAGTTAVSIGSQVMHMLTVMIVGLTMGTTVSIGQAVGAKKRKRAAQNIGAGKPDRALQTMRDAALISVGFGVLVCAVTQFTAEPVVSLFTDPATADGAAVVRLGGQYLRGYVWDCIFAGIHFCFGGYFCACGKSGISFFHNILAIVLVRIPGVYLTSRLFPDTLFPMGLATGAGSILSIIICVIAFAVIRKKAQSGKQEITL